MDTAEDQSRLVTVESYLHPTEAHIAAGRVRAEGIPVHLHGINHVSANWLIANALGGIRLQVPAQHVAHAKEILATDVHFEPPDLDVCPACGSTDTTTHSTAWKISFLAVHLLNIPLPWSKNRRRCQACGNSWSGDR